MWLKKPVQCTGNSLKDAFLRTEGLNSNIFNCREEIQNHSVKWKTLYSFQCKVTANASTGFLDPCICRVSVRMVGVHTNTQCSLILFAIKTQLHVPVELMLLHIHHVNLQSDKSVVMYMCIDKILWLFVDKQRMCKFSQLQYLYVPLLLRF